MTTTGIQAVQTGENSKSAVYERLSFRESFHAVLVDELRLHWDNSQDNGTFLTDVSFSYLVNEPDIA